MPANAEKFLICGKNYDLGPRKGFNFPWLEETVKTIWAACPDDWRITDYENVLGGSSPTFTQEGCESLTGGWGRYPGEDVWGRLTAWKIPLLQLIVLFPRPPLGVGIQFFVICRLISDPIGTIRSLLLVVSRCQYQAWYWKELFEHDGELSLLGYGKPDQKWKSLAIITMSYGELGYDEQDVREKLKKMQYNVRRKGVEDRKKIWQLLIGKAQSLAADRSTKSLPVIVALSIFICCIALAFVKAATNATSQSTYLNVEAHSTAFSALYFWIIPAVTLACIIGASQTQDAIPRILHDFEDDMDRELKSMNIERLERSARKTSRQMPSWQPLRPIGRPQSASAQVPNVQNDRYDGKGPPDPENDTFLPRVWDVDSILPITIVLTSTLTGVLVSTLVPPEGWNCRSCCQTLIFLCWLLSYMLDMYSEGLIHLCGLSNDAWRFTFTCIKDFVFAAANFIGLMVTQAGVFNRCSCYTGWGRTGLALPHIPAVAKVLSRHIEFTYPAIIFSSIGFQLIVIPLYLVFRYRLSLRVFLQRDDGKSNLYFFYNFISSPENRGQNNDVKPGLVTLDARERGDTKKEAPLYADRATQTTGVLNLPKSQTAEARDLRSAKS